MRRALLAGMLVGFSMLVVGLVWAAPAGQMDTQVKRVALFKNGLGFFVREGKLPEGQVVKIGTFAAPAHGTFWLSYPKQVDLLGLVARETTTTTEAPITNTMDLLAANVGRKVTISWPGQNRDAVNGVVLSVTVPPEAPRVDPYAWGHTSSDSYNRNYYPSSSRLVLIQTAAGVVATETAGSQVMILGDTPVVTSPKKNKVWELEARLKQPAPGATVAASYLAKGITWAPSYIVDISDPKEARISAKAEVINEAEALQEVHLDLVTGFPNLAYADVISPLAGKEDLAGFLAALAKRSSAQGGGYTGYAAAMTQSMPMGGPGSYDERSRSIMPAYGSAAVGVTAEDLFLYPVEKVTLNKGEVGYFPLFGASVPYKTIYTWNIPDYLNDQDQYGNPQREARNPQEEVWHSIKLTNTTKLPWTTAPAQTVKNEQILGQDMLDYTSPTTKTTLKITRAMGIQAEQKEVEKAREREAVRSNYYGWVYDRVTIEGKLRLTNHKTEAVDMEIKKLLSGEMQESAPTAQVEKLAQGMTRMNPLNELTWNVTIAPGEQKEITYTYQALIRR
jgi:hypothetical protein